MGKTTAKFISPSGTRRPSPMAGGSLCAGMDLGAELREEFIGIHADDRVIAKEIRAAQAVAVAGVGMHFTQCAFRTLDVLEAQGRARPLEVVVRVKHQEIGTKVIHYECRDLGEV